MLNLPKTAHRFSVPKGIISKSAPAAAISVYQTKQLAPLLETATKPKRAAPSTAIADCLLIGMHRGTKQGASKNAPVFVNHYRDAEKMMIALTEITVTLSKRAMMP